MSVQLISYKAETTARKFHRSEAFFRGLMGPIGSGKSVACVNEVLRNAFSQAPNEACIRKTRWAAVRNTYPELKSTTIKTWQDWVPDSICPIVWGAPITGTMRVRLPDNTKVELEILFLALDKPKDVKKLLSLELTGIWFNEAREIPKSVVDAGTGRVGRYPPKREGGPTQKSVIADTNPPDDDHWWYRFAEHDPAPDEVVPTNWEFFQQPPALIEVAGDWHPNPVAENIVNLPGGYSYYLDQLSGKSRDWIKVYVLGQYGTVQDGRPVYPGYNDDIHCAKAPIQAHPKVPLLLGWDFGLTPACIVCQLTPRGRLIVLREFVAERMGLEQLVTQVVKPELKRLYPNHGIGLSVGDPAGNAGSDTDERSCMDVLKANGIRTIPASSNSPMRRIRAVSRQLSVLVDGMPGFQISPECKVLRKGFNGGYKYNRIQISGDERYRDVPDKNRFSHPHDALQYIAMTALASDEREKEKKAAMQNVQQHHRVVVSSAGY